MCEKRVAEMLANPGIRRNPYSFVGEEAPWWVDFMNVS
jgi:hypothetical protein